MTSFLSHTLAAAFLLLIALSSVQAKDWNSVAELTLDLRVYRAFCFCTTGLHVWEHITYGLPFEIKIYTRRLPFRWGMVPYLIIRYSLYIHLVATLVNINADATTGPINCEAWLIGILVSLSLATVLTCLIFIVRAIAIWRKNFWISLFLAVLWAASAAMHFSSPARLKSAWNPQMQGCATYFVRPAHEYNSAYLLIMLTDLACFVLATWRLRSMHRSGVGRILFRQGMGYFGIAFALNAICLGLLYANLNPIMGYLVSPFAAVMSGIMACRAFQELQRGARQNICITSSNGQAWGVKDTHGPTVPPMPTAPGSQIFGGFGGTPESPTRPHEEVPPAEYGVSTTFGGFDDGEQDDEAIPMPVTTRFGPPSSFSISAPKSPGAVSKGGDSFDDVAELEYEGRPRSNTATTGEAASSDEAPFSGTTVAPTSPLQMASHPYQTREPFEPSSPSPQYTFQREIQVQDDHLARRSVTTRKPPKH